MPMAQQIEIDGVLIASGEKPYIIAELSGNHNGSIERALALVQAAADAGADAIKLQTFRADTITIDHDGPEFQVNLELWKNRTLYDLYEEAHTPWEWHQAIFNKGKELGITVFSSPFDFSSVEFLESFDVPAYKIASPELVDIPLIERVARTGKPMIMSTGMATVDEINDAVTAAKNGGCSQLVLLHCVSSYPAPYEQTFLKNIPELSEKFNVPIGLSDHSLGTVVPVAAVALGACVIEKHFTLDRSEGGVDSSFSIEPVELERLVNETDICAKSIMGPAIGPKNSEEGVLKYRRSLYIVQDISLGEEITEKNVKSIRPGLGLKPKFYPDVLGSTAKRDLMKGEALKWEMIEK